MKKRFSREKMQYHADGARRDLDGHIWVAVIVVAVAVLAHLIFGWGGVLVVAVLTIAGLLITKLTVAIPSSAPEDDEMSPADRDQAELESDLQYYMGNQGCLVAIALIFVALVVIMIIVFVGNQSI